MKLQKVQQKVAKYVSRVTGEHDVELEHDLYDDLQVDSLDLVEIMLYVEDKFGVDIFDHSAKINTVEDLANVVKREMDKK